MKNERFISKSILFFLLLFWMPAVSPAASLEPPPDFPLLEAVKKNDVQAVRAILDQSASQYEINQAGRSGDKPLTSAARNGNLEIVKLLVDHGAVVDAGKERGERTPLAAAAGRGHADVVQYLITRGADVNAKGKGLTPLLVVVAERYSPLHAPGNEEKTIRILLENGADVNVQDESWLKTGRTPLMYAVIQGDAALVQALLARGARKDLKNKEGDTALALAKKAGMEYIAQLLEKPNDDAKESSRPVDPAADSLFVAVKEGRAGVVRKLIAKGMNVNLRTSDGSTPLMYAAYGNQLDIVRILIKSGADVNAKNGKNNTALIYAAIKGNARVAGELLKNKADANVKNISKGDALMYAVTGKKTKAADVLLQHGASVSEKYEDEKSALMLAVSNGASDIAGSLIRHKADVNAADKNQITALMLACEKGNAELVAALLKAGADIHQKSKYGDTALNKAIAARQLPIVRILVKSSGHFDRRDALFSAVIDGNLDIVKALLTPNTDVNMRGFAGGTLLMAAADKNLSLVKYLISRGANAALKDDEGDTALMEAVKSFNEQKLAITQYLIDHGADVDAVNQKGETALILAVKNFNADVVKALVEKGRAASLSLKDREGKSAWTYAVEGDKPDMVSILEKAGAGRDYLGMEWRGNVSSQKEPFIKVVETQKEWSDLWQRAFVKPAPGMDFERYAVACVFLGHSAQWLYSIVFGEPVMRGNQLVIEYGLLDVMLRLSGPFKAGGQYHMKVFEKRKGVTMIVAEGGPNKRVK